MSSLSVLSFFVAACLGGVLGTLLIMTLVYERYYKLARKVADLEFIVERMRIQVAALHAEYYVPNKDI